MNIVPEAPWEHPYERVKKGLEAAERIAKHGTHNQKDHGKGVGFQRAKHVATIKPIKQSGKDWWNTRILTHYGGKVGFTSSTLHTTREEALAYAKKKRAVVEDLGNDTVALSSRVVINTTGTSSARKLQSRRKLTMLGPSSNPLLKHPNVASRKRAKMKWLKGERARRARDL